MAAAGSNQESDTVDLLNPANLQTNYVRQLHHTMEAYEPPLIALGEALQNALDAVMKAGPGSHKIQVGIDFDANRVEVEDTGIGFPNAPELLFLGGSQKNGNQGLKMFGLVGVGMKVILFSSSNFLLKANDGNSAHFIEINDAYRFAEEAPPPIVATTPLPTDPSPLDHQGTKISYTFPNQDNPLTATVDLIRELCLPEGPDRDFGKTLAAGVQSGRYPCRFAVLLDSFLRRYTYCGDVLRGLGHYPDHNVEIDVSVTCTDPVARLGEEMGQLFDDQNTFSFSCKPSYLRVEDTLDFSPEPKPGLFTDGLGNGGANLELTASGFNTQIYS